MNPNNIQVYTERVESTEYRIPIRNLWYMLLYAWNEAPLKINWYRDDIEDAPTLDALLASVLVKLIEQRLRIGLGCSYVEEERSLAGIRGRVNFTESLKHRTFERGEAYCEFQQYSANAPKNQIVRSTIARLVQKGQFGPELGRQDEIRHKLRRLTRTLDSIDLIDLTLDFIRRQQLGRNDGDYRLMLAICELILQRQMPTESAGHSVAPTIDRDALVLHRVYERFVTNFYRTHLNGWTVTAQKRLGWYEKYPNQYLPTMSPDLVLEDEPGRNIIILDTKFTASSLIKNRWGSQKLDSTHLYQLYAYLKTQEHLSVRHLKATGILLYPGVDTVVPETIELQNHIMKIEYIDLSDHWQDIERHLLDIVKVV